MKSNENQRKNTFLHDTVPQLIRQFSRKSLNVSVKFTGHRSNRCRSLKNVDFLEFLIRLNKLLFLVEHFHSEVVGNYLSAD